MQSIYLLLFPIGKNLSAKNQIKLSNLKRGPYFLDIDIDIRFIDEKEIKINGVSVTQKSYIYDNSVLFFQFSYDIGDVFSEKIISVKSEINSELRKKILKTFAYNGNLVEEYSVVLINNPKNIKTFVKKNQPMLARFIRSANKKIDQPNIDDILFSKVSYSDDDLTVIDWEGAIVIDKESDFESQLELLKIGNYQLLRYRILDKMVEENLSKVRQAIENPRKGVRGNDIVRSVIKNRLALLLDFDKVDQSLLLVGDWYSAKIYKIIMEEFYIDDWGTLVKNKLDNLEAIDTAVRENLVLDWRRILDIVQIVGWLVVLFGYILLYLLDAHILKL